MSIQDVENMFWAAAESINKVGGIYEEPDEVDSAMMEIGVDVS